MHWHGIELESYYDGVAGFGGSARRVTPVIAPRDSFYARFTPPRAVSSSTTRMSTSRGSIAPVSPGR